jgi:hypothetical protein
MALKMPVTIEFDIIEPNDILVFTNSNSKADNDSTNKLRELIITNIFCVSEDYFADPIYGEYWKHVRNGLRNALHPLCSLPYKTIIIAHKGGMSFNYDFLITYLNPLNEPIHSVKVEFKNNNSDVKNLIQFLELYDKDCKATFDMFDYSYAEYYYDYFLDKYLEIDNVIGEVLKPDRQTYLRYVSDIKYKHPFFRQLYENKDKNKQQKTVLVDESRTQFLSTYAPDFKFNKITKKIQESQTNKVFLLWDKNMFHVQTIDVEKIAILGIKPNSINKLYFDVEVENLIYDIRVRLNWGNNNGIANPRWKFSFIDK